MPANLHFYKAELTRPATFGITHTSNGMIALGCVQPLVPWKRQYGLDTCHVFFDVFHVFLNLCQILFHARYLIYISQTESLLAVEACTCVLKS